MSEHDDIELRETIHRAYEGIPTPPGLAGRISGALRTGGRKRRRVPQWAVGVAVAAVLAAVVGVATLPSRFGRSPSTPAAVVPASTPTPSPAPTAQPTDTPTAAPAATAAPTPTPTRPPATPRPTPTPPVLASGPGWQQEWSGTSKDLLGIDFVDRLHGWAVGAGGTILATSDGGSTWNTQRSGVTTDLSSVSFVDALHGWAAGKADTIVMTSNGGATWTVAHTGVGRDLRGVQFIDTSHGWVVAVDSPPYGSLLATSDGGRHWTSLTTPIQTYAAAARFADRLHGWVSDGTSIAATSDGGTTWTTVKSSAYPWYEITCTDSMHAYALDGSAPFVNATNDGGATWQSHVVYQQGASLSGITAVDPHHLWAVGNIYDASTGQPVPMFAVSTDGGASWTSHRLTTPQQQYPEAVAAVDSSDAWVVGEGGLIVKLTG